MLRRVYREVLRQLHERMRPERAMAREVEPAHERARGARELGESGGGKLRERA